MRIVLSKCVMISLIDRYATRWYTAPVETRRLLLFIMQNTTKVYMLNIGNIITASLDSFAKVINSHNREYRVERVFFFFFF